MLWSGLEGKPQAKALWYVGNKGKLCAIPREVKAMAKEGNKEEAGKEAPEIEAYHKLRLEAEAYHVLKNEVPKVWEYIMGIGKYYTAEAELIVELTEMTTRLTVNASNHALQYLVENNDKKAEAEIRLSAGLQTLEGALSSLGVFLTVACPGVLNGFAPRLRELLKHVENHENSGALNPNEADSLSAQIAEVISQLTRKAVECTLSLRGMKLEVDKRTGAWKVVYQWKNYVYKIDLEGEENEPE